MSEPTEPARPLATDLPEYAPAEPGFLERNWRVILKASGFIVLVAACASIYQCAGERNARKAAQEFSEATDEAALRATIANHPRAAAADSARMLLAAKLRDGGNADEALTTLREVAGNSRDTSLAALAQLGIGQLLETQAKMDEALAAYQDVSARFQKTYLAPHGLLGQARIAMAQGRKDDARRLYEEVKSQYPDSVAMVEAESRLTVLGPSQTASGTMSLQSAPSPAPAAPPQP
jgi:predicted negative regulator of RcsB-dependent stress response